MTSLTKPTVVFHADWGNKKAKRWYAKATLNEKNGRYTAIAPAQVENPGLLIPQLRAEVGVSGCAFAGFDFPIGVPDAYAKLACVATFRELISKLGADDWRDFYSVCDEPGQIGVHRPFYPNGKFKGRRKEDLYRGHGVSSIDPLLRRCERGGNGKKTASCLFWTLGGNQVGKAAISGWREMLGPALKDGGPICLWPFDGPLPSLLTFGNLVVAETWPAAYYGWFAEKLPGSKRILETRKNFGPPLIQWADENHVGLDSQLGRDIGDGFPQGGEDAFDAVVGLFAMLHVCRGEHASGEPDEPSVRNVEGWILGRDS